MHIHTHILNYNMCTYTHTYIYTYIYMQTHEYNTHILLIIRNTYIFLSLLYLYDAALVPCFSVFSIA